MMVERDTCGDEEQMPTKRRYTDWLGPPQAIRNIRQAVIFAIVERTVAPIIVRRAQRWLRTLRKKKHSESLRVIFVQNDRATPVA